LKRKLFAYLGIYGRNSYAQCGEDLIIDFIFNTLEIYKPSYLDIGAHHPKYINNTYFFYKNGSKGVNVEPDKNLLRAFKFQRKRDVNLNIGVGVKAGIMDFYVISSRTLNTFSKVEADRYLDEFGFKLMETRKIKIRTTNDIIKEYFLDSPDLISIDVEGMDYDILESINLATYRPIVICIETMSYSESGAGERDYRIDHYLNENGYMKYAETYINTIYVEKKKWLR